MLAIKLGNKVADELGNSEQLEDETKDQIKLLEKINRLGFITTDSQDGIILRGNGVPDNVKLYHQVMKKAYKSVFDGKLGYDEVDYDKINQDYESKGGTFRKDIRLSQRAYLTGIMDADDADIFVHFFNQTDKVAYVDKIPVTYATGNTTGVLIKEKVVYDRMNKEVVASTGLGASITDNDVKFDLKTVLTKEQAAKLKASDLKKLVRVNCFDPHHGRKADSKEGLFVEVINALKQVDETRKA